MLAIGERIRQQQNSKKDSSSSTSPLLQRFKNNQLKGTTAYSSSTWFRKFLRLPPIHIFAIIFIIAILLSVISFTLLHHNHNSTFERRYDSKSAIGKMKQQTKESSKIVHHPPSSLFIRCIQFFISIFRNEGEDDEGDLSSTIDKILETNPSLKLLEEFDDYGVVNIDESSTTVDEPFVKLGDETIEGQPVIKYRQDRIEISNFDRSSSVYEHILMGGGDNSMKKEKSTTSTTTTLSVIIPIRKFQTISKEFPDSLITALDHYHSDSKTKQQEIEIIFVLSDASENAKKEFTMRHSFLKMIQNVNNNYKFRIISPFDMMMNGRSSSKHSINNKSSLLREILKTQITSSSATISTQHHYIPFGLSLLLGVSSASSSADNILILSPLVKIESPNTFFFKLLLADHNHHMTKDDFSPKQCLVVIDEGDDSSNTVLADGGWTVEISSASVNDDKFYDEMLHFVNRDSGSPSTTGSRRTHDQQKEKTTSSSSSATKKVDAISLHLCSFWNRRVFARIFGQILQDDHRKKIFDEFVAVTTASSSDETNPIPSSLKHFLSLHLTTPTEADLYLNEKNSPSLLTKIEIRDRSIQSLFASVIQLQMLMDSITVEQVQLASMSLKKQVRKSYSSLTDSINLYDELAPSSSSMINEKAKLLRVISTMKMAGTVVNDDNDKDEDIISSRRCSNDVATSSNLKSTNNNDHIIDDHHHFCEKLSAERRIINVLKNVVSHGDSHCVRNEKFRFASDHDTEKDLLSVLECATDQMIKNGEEAKNAANILVPTISDHLLGWQMSLRAKLMKVVDKQKKNKKVDDDDEDEEETFSSSSDRIFHDESRLTPSVLYNVRVSVIIGEDHRDENSKLLLQSSAVSLSSHRHELDEYLDLARIYHSSYRNDVFSIKEEEILPSRNNASSSSSTTLLSIALKSKKVNSNIKKEEQEERKDASLFRVVWYSICCGCCGFSAEIAHYVRTLSKQHIISLIQGPECFCPGLPHGFADTLYRQHIHLQQLGTHSFVQQFHLAKRTLLQQQRYKMMKSKRRTLMSDSSSSSSSSSLKRFVAEQVRQSSKSFISKIFPFVNKNNDNDGMLMMTTMSILPNPIDQEKIIWISHTDPSSFQQQGLFLRGRKPNYLIGRTMYEFSRIPEPWDGFLDSADELWVPSKFVRKVFIDAIELNNREVAQENRNNALNSNQWHRGLRLDQYNKNNNQESRTSHHHQQYKRKIEIEPDKIIVVPEGVDTSFFDPKVHEPLRLTNDRLFDDEARKSSSSKKQSLLSFENSFCNRDSFFSSSVNNQGDDVKSSFTQRNHFKHQHSPWSRNLSHEEKEVKKQRKRYNTSNNSLKKSSSSSNSPFQFFSNFKWEPRKGWETLLESYFDAFFLSQDKDDTTLVILSYYFFPHGIPSPQWSVFNETQIMKEVYEKFNEKYLKKKYYYYDDGENNFQGKLFEMPRFCILSESVSEFELAQLFRGADAFVLPTRGEGWGLPTMQAMSMGLPVISTNWGGSVDFTTKETSYLIELDGVEAVPKDSPYGWREGKKWSTPSVPHLTKLMRHVFEEGSEKLKSTIGKKARNHIVRNFDDLEVAKIVDARLRQIRELI